MAAGLRDQRQLDLVGQFVCAVSLNLQQRQRQPRKACPYGAYPVASPAPVHSSSACRSNVPTCPPVLKRGTSSDTAVRLGEVPTLSRGSAGLVCHSTRPAAIAAGSSLDDRATPAATAAISNTTQRRSKADLKGPKGYCNPARRLYAAESSEQGSKLEGTRAIQRLLRTQPADDSEESFKPRHQIAPSHEDSDPKDDLTNRNDKSTARRENLRPAPACAVGPIGRMPASGLGAVAGDVLVQICSYVEAKDIVRLSMASPLSFPKGLWRQLHLARYGPPNHTPAKALPLFGASRLQLQSDFPIHHARLYRIRRCHELMRPTVFEEDYCPRVRFAEESLRREDKLLREEESTRRSKSPLRMEVVWRRIVRVVSGWIALTSVSYVFYLLLRVFAAEGLSRAGARRKQHTKRTGALQELALTKRINTVERMSMVAMKSAVERHAYPPGCRPKVPQASNSGPESPEGRGKPMGRRRNPPASLAGLFCDD